MSLRCVVLSHLALSGALVGCTADRVPFAPLEVQELSDTDRRTLFEDYRPRVEAAFPSSRVLLSEPMAVLPEGAVKDTQPGPVSWEIQMHLVDYATGSSYLVRPGADRKSFAISPLSAPAPLSARETDLSLQIAQKDPAVAAIVAEARAASYRVDLGAMLMEPNEECPSRCVDVRFIGFGMGNPSLYPAMSIVFAQVSLGTESVVAFREFDWKPNTP